MNWRTKQTQINMFFVQSREQTPCSWAPKLVDDAFS